MQLLELTFGRFYFSFAQSASERLNLRPRNRCRVRGHRCPLLPRRRPHSIWLSGVKPWKHASLRRFFSDLVHQFGIVGQRALQTFATLSEFRGAVAIPRTALLNNVQIYAEISHFARDEKYRTESNFKFALLERRRHLVLYDFHFRVEAHHVVAVFDF